MESICTPTQCTYVSSIIPATSTHVQMVNHQQNLPAFEKSISYKANRVGIADRFEGDSLQRMVSLDVDLIDFYDKQIQKLDLYLEQHAKIDAADAFYRLQSIPGVGRILAMTMLYERIALSEPCVAAAAAGRRTEPRCCGLRKLTCGIRR